MSIPTSSLRIRLGSAFAAALIVAACGSATQPTAPVVEPDEPLASLLLQALQDEYHAETLYEGVMDDFGQVRPFSNIVGAEVRRPPVRMS